MTQVLLKIKPFSVFIERNKLNPHPFQQECFDWCIAREEGVNTINAKDKDAKEFTDAVKSELIKTRGGILALEMGLGKTIIMLGVIECNFKRRTLIILPKTLINQWVDAIKSMLGYDALVYHGSNKKSMTYTLAELMKYAIVITTYGQMSRPTLKQTMHNKRESKLYSVQWDRVICDEAHNACNNKTAVYKGLMGLNKNSVKWLVTGTPIQNKMEDLYLLYSLLGFQKNVAFYDSDNMKYNVMKRLLYLRTKESEIIPMPPLHQTVITVKWESDNERQLASHVHSILTFCGIRKLSVAKLMLQSADTSNNDDMPHNTLDGANILDGASDAGMSARALRMKYLTVSRQLCVFPRMIRPEIKKFDTLFENNKDGSVLDDSDEYDTEGAGDIEGPIDIEDTEDTEDTGYATVSDDDGGIDAIGDNTRNEYIRDEYPNIDIGALYEIKGKINTIVKTLIERKCNGSGKIVFCHYKFEMDEIAIKLQEDGIMVKKFDGRLSNKERKVVLDNPVDVLIAQIKMCREGLNLQKHYSEVHFTSPHFNPSVEEQSIARCWRLGQQKPVYVFRYLMENCMDDDITNSITNSITVDKKTGYSIDGYSEYIQTKKKVMGQFVKTMALS